jgi:hypothetical protein
VAWDVILTIWKGKENNLAVLSKLAEKAAHSYRKIIFNEFKIV